MPDVASAAKLFYEKCVNNANDVIAYTQKKLQDPGSLVNFEVTGTLVDAAKKDMGSLASVAGGYLERNAAALTMEALNAADLDDKATAALNQFYSLIANAVASYNDLILRFTQKTAKNAMKELDSKKEIRASMMKGLTTYLATLEQMREGPSVFNAYLNELRKAMVKVHSANTNLNSVYNAFRYNDLFLDKVFNAAKKDLDDAAALIKPRDNPYLDPNFLANQVIFKMKKTVTSPRLTIVKKIDTGKVDPGTPALLEGNFSLAQIGDFVRIFPMPVDAKESPLNPDFATLVNAGEYKIEEILSSSKARLSPIISPAGKQGSPVSPSVSYGKSEMEATYLHAVDVGDSILWEMNSHHIEFKVVTKLFRPGDKKPYRVILDKFANPTLFDSVGGYARGEWSIKGKKNDKSSPWVKVGNATLFRGAPTPLDPSAPVYLYNTASASTEIIERVIYQVERQDGFRADRKTFYDSEADFTSKNIVGQMLNVIGPNEIKGQYKITRVVNKTTLEVGNKLPSASKLTKTTGPIFNVEYEIKADLGVPAGKNVIANALSVPAAALTGGLSAKFAPPSAEDQFTNILAIPAMTNKVVLSSKAYIRHTLLANASFEAFITALDTLMNALPSIMKNTVLKVLDKAAVGTLELRKNMSHVLNGNENSISTSSAYQVDPLRASAMAFKWVADIHLMRGLIKLVPSDALTKLNITKGPVDFYRGVVARIKSIDTYTSGTAVVKGEDSREEIGQLETQLFTLLTQGNTLIFAGTLREEIISLGYSILRNLELAQKRDADIYAALKSWVDYPLPNNDALDKIEKGLDKALKNLGLDKAYAAFNKGKFNDFFNISNGKAATYVGSALIALALLKECFDSPEEANELDKIVRELEKEEQLIDVQFSINFDLAIFRKLQECLNFGALSYNLNLKEILCELAGEAKDQAGSMLDSVFGSTDAGMASPAEKTAGNTNGLS